MRGRLTNLLQRRRPNFAAIPQRLDTVRCTSSSPSKLGGVKGKGLNPLPFSQSSQADFLTGRLLGKLCRALIEDS
ncbi:hypothetical protein H6G97_45345 [Nostoc flagelliforme FACHB-838]|uniref:Transposase n=1 Tax=Nostoc flagelliforme FACHB-838 TaxID=2692904 RepID=A0ABR8E3R1_9NOSO|nr:hypothetical protein [Nostoc flagelliforme FACHB-838]